MKNKKQYNGCYNKKLNFRTHLQISSTITNCRITQPDRFVKKFFKFFLALEKIAHFIILIDLG